MSAEHVKQDKNKGISAWWYVAALLIPIVGVVAGIVFLAKGRIGPGIALWGTALLGAFLGTVLLRVVGGDLSAAAAAVQPTLVAVVQALGG